MKKRTYRDELLALALSREVLTAKAIAAAGIPSAVTSRLVGSGELIRLGCGVYRHPDGPISEHHDLIQVAARIDQGIVVLISALQFHNLGVQRPHEVWIQLPAGLKLPPIYWPAVHVVRSRVAALLTQGVEYHVFSGIKVGVTTPARTVADCFKYRNQVGLDTCIEAASELFHRDRNAIDELYSFAKLNRVNKVMLPYLEGLR